MNEITQARKLIAKYLMSDNKFAEGYIANIAMYLFDNCNIIAPTNAEKFDDAARGILNLIFDIKLEVSTE